MYVHVLFMYDILHVPGKLHRSIEVTHCQCGFAHLRVSNSPENQTYMHLYECERETSVMSVSLACASHLTLKLYWRVTIVLQGLTSACCLVYIYVYIHAYTYKEYCNSQRHMGVWDTCKTNAPNLCFALHTYDYLQHGHILLQHAHITNLCASCILHHV
jgi:hypothetical protein